MLRAAVAEVAHSPLAGGLAHEEDLGAMCSIWEAVMEVFSLALVLIFSEDGVGEVEPKADRERRERMRVLRYILSLFPFLSRRV